MKRINEMKLKMDLLKENFFKNLESKKHKGLSGLEIVIYGAVSLGVVALVWTFLNGSLTGTILPAIQQKIMSFF